VTVVADPHNGPDVEHLAELVQRELDAFTRMANERPRGRDGDRGSRSVPLR
jgi:hypothetical protein